MRRAGRIQVKQAAKSLFLPVNAALGSSGDVTHEHPPGLTWSILGQSQGHLRLGKGLHSAASFPVTAVGLMWTGQRHPRVGGLLFQSPKAVNKPVLRIQSPKAVNKSILRNVSKPAGLVCLESPAHTSCVALLTEAPGSLQSGICSGCHKRELQHQFGAAVPHTPFL